MAHDQPRTETTSASPDNQSTKGADGRHERIAARSKSVLYASQTFVLVLAWVLALLDVTPPGANDAAPFDETALRWILYLALGWSMVAAGFMHTVFARRIATGIGWQTSGFQYEVGFADLAFGLAAVYAADRDVPEAWVAASIGGGVFLLLDALNHIREMFVERNFAPGNSLIVISDLGIPISLFVLLLTTHAI